MSIVFCVIPTHNRLQCLKNCLTYLSIQDYKPIHIVVVNDGSIDGTREFLNSLPQQHLTVLQGNGNLWWGRAMYLGMKYVCTHGSSKDYLLMLNDDVKIEKNYISSLLYISRKYINAVVGSVQCCEISNEILSYGFSINYLTISIKSIPNLNHHHINIDALPGRGVLYPLVIVKKIGFINKNLFPHYYGDLEYSARAKERGFLLVSSQNAKIYTNRISSDAHIQAKWFIFKRLSFRSKNNLIHLLLFFSIRGPFWLRIWVLPRYICIIAYKAINRILNSNVC